MTVQDLLHQGAAQLPSSAGLPEPRREARFLLARALGVADAWLLAHGDDEVSAEVATRYRGWLTRRAAGEPAHYVVGTCPFWGREFAVSPAVLIPRPETELIVERVLSLRLAPHCRVLDVGTGSGCLAVTLALELDDAQVVATDISIGALAVARHNVSRLAATVRLVNTDLAGSLGGPFDLVVTNLPYLPTATIADLAVEIRDHEPVGALDGGQHGVDFLLRLLATLPGLLAPGGVALLELDPDQPARLATAVASGGLEVTARIAAAGVVRVLELSRGP